MSCFLHPSFWELNFVSIIPLYKHLWFKLVWYRTFLILMGIYLLANIYLPPFSTVNSSNVYISNLTKRNVFFIIKRNSFLINNKIIKIANSIHFHKCSKQYNQIKFYDLIFYSKYKNYNTFIESNFTYKLVSNILLILLVPWLFS